MTTQDTFHTYVKSLDSTIVLNGKVADKNDPDFVRYLSADGRTYQVKGNNTPQNSQMVDLADVATRLGQMVTEIKDQFVDRDNLIDAALLALVGGENCFVLGKPGTAKTAVFEQFAQGIAGRFWQKQLASDTTRSELIGPQDTQAFQQGIYKRRLAGIATSHIAFLDEIWKAGSQVTEILLEALQSKAVTDGDQKINIPLLSAFSASNELPQDDESGASWDRWAIRVYVDYIADPSDFAAMLIAEAGSQRLDAYVTADEIRLLNATAQAIAFNVGTDVLKSITELWQYFRDQGRDIGDRRWRKTLQLACAQALIAGRDNVTSADLMVGKFTLWDDPDQISKVTQKLSATLDKTLNEVLNYEAMATALQKEFSQASGMSAEEQARVMGKARKLETKVKATIGKLADNTHKARLENIVGTCKTVTEGIMDFYANLGS